MLVRINYSQPKQAGHRSFRFGQVVFHEPFSEAVLGTEYPHYTD